MQRLVDLGAGLSICSAKISELREQDLNARVMDDAMFAQLVANIRRRGRLESLPYCAVAEGGTLEDIEIVSGHHRVRGAAAAWGADAEIPFLLDESGLTRSQITAKQLAHNAIEGQDDPDIIRQLLAKIPNIDDLLETFIGAELAAPKVEPVIFPDIAIEFRTLSFAFLPHQMAAFDALMDSLAGRQDVVGVAPMEMFEPFVAAVGRYSRVKRVGRAATVIAELTEIALREALLAEAQRKGAEDGDGANGPGD